MSSKSCCLLKGCNTSTGATVRRGTLSLTAMLTEHVTLRRHADPAELNASASAVTHLVAAARKSFPFRDTLPVLGTFGGGAIVRNAGALAFFCRAMLCHTAPKLVRYFLFYYGTSSHSRLLALVLALMTDGLPRPIPFCAFRSALSIPRHLLCLCHTFFPIPFDTSTVNICATRFLIAIIRCPLFPCRTSCLRICCLLRKTPFRLLCLSTSLSSSHHLLDASPSRPLPFPSGHF